MIDDLLIKYNLDECEILDEGSVFELLKSHSKNKLYKNSISFDPYKKPDKIKNAKSYLKWCVPGVGKEKNIEKIKELKVIREPYKIYNKKIVKPIKYLFNISYFIILPAYILIIFILILIGVNFAKRKTIYESEGKFTGFHYILNIFFFSILILSVISLFIGSIIQMVNNSNLAKANSLHLGAIFIILRIINIFVFCFNIVLIFILGIFMAFINNASANYKPKQEIDPSWIKDKEDEEENKDDKRSPILPDDGE